MVSTDSIILTASSSVGKSPYIDAKLKVVQSLIAVLLAGKTKSSKRKAYGIQPDETDSTLVSRSIP